MKNDKTDKTKLAWSKNLTKSKVNGDKLWKMEKKN